MPDDVVLRAFCPADLPRLLDIAVAAWTPIFSSFRSILGGTLFVRVFADWQASRKEEIRRACAAGSSAHVLVAERSGMVVGFATYYCDPDTGLGQIGNNAVDPAFQGQGIASEMYRWLLDDMRARGLRVAQVSTGGDPAHAPARRAYAKVGFHVALPGLDYFQALDGPAGRPDADPEREA
jgi:ribosomal protein S18 acetylase RimI-like enzyme